MIDYFQLAFQYLLKDEGTTFVNDKRDSGGATKFGITFKALQNWLKLSTIDVSVLENLDVFEAQNFYKEVFWDHLCCDLMTVPAIAICIFDSAALYGPGTAAILAQKAISQISAAGLKFDGIIGDSTLKLLNLAKAETFLDAYHALILKRIDAVCTADPKNEVFREGWTNRADRLLTLKEIKT